MSNSLQNTRADLIGRFVDFLWHQWSALGAAGQAWTGDDRIIDPEALVLATTRFGRHDPRLLDEAIDWLRSNGHRVNLQRQNRLNMEWPVADQSVLAAIGTILSRQSALAKWRNLTPVATEGGETRPLFVRPDGTPLPVFQDPDPDFLRHGLIRGTLVTRGMSQAPDPRRPDNLLLTLRALFGVNARAEIMGWLLTHESGHPAAIARSTGYFSKWVQQTLNEMADSRHIRSGRHGREKNFWLQAADWRFLVQWDHPEGFPRWIEWMPFFRTITIFVDALGQDGLLEWKEGVQAIHLRKALEETSPHIAQAGLSQRMISTPDLKGKDMLQAMAMDLDTLGRTLEGPRPPRTPAD